MERPLRSLVLATLLLVAGCVDRRMDVWIGHPADELLPRWGAPTNRIEQRDGTSMLTWSETWIETETHACRKSFIVGRDGRIARWVVSDCRPWTSIPAPTRPN